MIIRQLGFLILCFAVFPAAGNPLAGQQGGREFYELRIYRTFDFEKQQAVERYLEQALVPALKRQSIDRVGVFNRMDDDNDHSVYMLIPFPNLALFTGLNDKLAKDTEYQAAAKAHFDRPTKNPVFDRIESRLLRAFRSIPRMELPQETREGGPRIFELRIYESHTEKHAALKVEMFDEGETQLMRDVKLGPVFFGETLIGADVPNLVYMLSASDLEAHKKHWQSFLNSEGWNRMKKLDRYKGAVSKIKNYFLKPTSFSDL